MTERELSTILFGKMKTAAVIKGVSAYVTTNRDGGVYLLTLNGKNGMQKRLCVFFFGAEFIADLERASDVLPMLVRDANVSAIAFDFCSYDTFSANKQFITLADVSKVAPPHMSARLILKDGEPHVEVIGHRDLVCEIATKPIELDALRRILAAGVGAGTIADPPKGKTNESPKETT